ncbi:hypothetical protein PVK06_049936 [Gossypium arboreum]|uniref:Uncharacterized protein n=1 Tax=Gossypium arboreum TaxID=29729 RepID=A0ABR0M9G7_GOSAR|nr:hypothetical protein PVK06_049936 [Gossypium arboreum]
MGGSLRAENEEEPRIFLSTVLLEAPLSPLNKKDCTALGPGSEGNELGCFSSTLIFLRARSACASRAIGALLSSYSSLDDSDGLRRSFPTKIEKAVSHRDVDSFSAPNEMGNFEPPIYTFRPFIFLNRGPARLASFQQPAGSTSVYDRAQ